VVSFDNSEAYEAYGGGVWLSAEDQKALTGQYRLFDMTDVVLIDSSEGNRYTAVWSDYPFSKVSCYIMFAGSTFVISEIEKDPEYWHQTLRFPKGFVGLLDIGQAVSVSFVYNIPSTVKLDKLSLQIVGEKPIPVIYKKK